MSLREIGWGVFLAGLPFAHFFLCPSQLNQWQSQTLWAQGWLALLFGFSVGQGGRPGVSNRPLGCWVAWVSLSVVGIWTDYLRHQQQHPIGLLPPFLHCLCLAAFYVAAMRQWTPALLTRLLTWLAYAGLVVVAYGVLQVMNFDQFYKFIDGTKQTDTLIGTIGNPTHFGTHLALLLPIFLWQRQWWWKVVAIVSVVLMGLTLSTSALLCGGAVIIWWASQEKPWAWWVAISLCGIGFFCAFCLWHPEWLNASGRIEAWQVFWQHYLVGNGQRQITGAGLGRIMDDSLRNLGGWPKNWRHVHCEPFQMLIEQGVIGLGLILWAIGHAVQTWRRLPKTAAAMTLAGMGIAFLLSSLLNFPAHLWLLASLGLVAYCGVYMLASEVV